MSAATTGVEHGPHGVRFSYGRWLERYRSDGIHAEPVTTRDPGKARRFDSKAAAEAHIEWAGWGPGEATAAPLPMKRPGDRLEWSSGTGALQKAKRGVVIAILPAGQSLTAGIEATGRRAVRVQAEEIAKSDRYVVEVQAVHGPAYYAPLVKTVDLELRETAAVKACMARVEAR
jgi:hypothetical protein